MSFWYNLFTFTVSAVSAAHPAVINLSKYSTLFTPVYYILCHRRWSSCFWIESKELAQNKTFSEYLQQTDVSELLEKRSSAYSGSHTSNPVRQEILWLFHFSSPPLLLSL